MQDQRHRIGAEVARQIRGDGLHDGGGLRRIGEIFADGDELALILVEGGDIGEGPADIDADTQFHRAVFSAPQPRGRGVVDVEIGVERDAVVVARGGARDVAARDVLAHPVDVALDADRPSRRRRRIPPTGDRRA